jgi:hypothetical protein
MPNELKQLQELAKRFKGKLSQCEVYDSNVCTTRTKPGRPWELLPVSGEPFLKRLRFTFRGRRVAVLANSTYAQVAASGTFASRPFTINAKQKVAFRSEFAELLSVHGEQYPVFTEDGRVSSDQNYVLSQRELASLVEWSGLEEGESLHFTRGEISFYLKQPDNDRISGAIDRVIELAEKVEIAKEELSLEQLPAQFHPIIPMIKQWALADDSERTDLLATASEAMLRRLTDEVLPYLDAIDAYLDSFRGGAPPEPAAALGWLAECALEAKECLEGRNSPKAGK